MNKRYALLIGINDYSLKPLDYCYNDIIKMEEALSKNCNFDKNDIHLISSHSENSNKNILELFEKSLEIIKKDFIQNEDGFFFFFSGHGLYVDEPSLYFHEELVEVSKIYNTVNEKLKPKNQFFVFDACYSGEKIKSIEEREIIEELYQQKLTSKSENKTVIAAARYDQTASEKKKFENGTLTHFFIKAILNKELYNENGFLTPSNIADYVRREVSLHKEFEQIPYTKSEDTGSYPFAFLKNLNNGVKLLNQSCDVGHSSIQNKLVIREAPTVFFYYRLSQAFPGVRGVRWFKCKLAIDGLKRFFKEPYYFDEASGYGTFKDPIWWFRGTSALSIKKFRILDDEKILINDDELIIDKVAVYNSTSYFSSFIYIQTKPDKPSGLYDIDNDKISQHIDAIGYSYESVGLYKGQLVRYEEMEDGAAIIDGEYTNLEGGEYRNRYLSKYNIFLVPKSSPYNSNIGNKLGKEYVDALLTNENLIEEFAVKYSRLPKNHLDQ